MYLGILSKTEKKLFLRLATNLALVDGTYAKEERELIEKYCDEMQIPYVENDEKIKVEDIVKAFSKIEDERTKKIILFEAIGLCLSDNHYDVKEREIIGTMTRDFGLDQVFADECEGIINEYILFQTRINQLILN